MDPMEPMYGRKPGWYVTRLTAMTAWPYAQSVPVVGPLNVRPATLSEGESARYWDGDLWRSAPRVAP